MNKYIMDPKILDDRKIWYEARFSSLTALYNYLNSNPKINKEVFTSRHSLDSNSSFYGEPLDVAINYLKGGYENNYKAFLDLKRNMDSKVVFNACGSDFEKTPVGSRISIPNYTAGHPKFMIKPSTQREIKYQKIYYNLGYPHYTKDAEIRNRGLIVLNLIKLLENNDYRVSLNTFELAEANNEYFYMSLVLKKIDSLLNVPECYFPFVAKEMHRRIFNNVLETMPVKDESWQLHGGKNIDNSNTRTLLKLKEDDILFGYPSTMGITSNLEESVRNCFDTIKLDKYIKMKKL